MAWNADATRMPYRMHSEYLRHLFLDNDLAEGRLRADGRPVSLRDVRIPVFAVSTLADHVAPWRSVYKIQLLTDADVTFVVSNGGHNAGIVNPPGNARRHHQIATHREDEKYVPPDAWQQNAVHHQGSWWPCWRDWLLSHSSGQIVPPLPGNEHGGYSPLGNAPGTYVLQS
jgi:polyhydroxyalkanoate synthase